MMHTIERRQQGGNTRLYLDGRPIFSSEFSDLFGFTSRRQALSAIALIIKERGGKFEDARAIWDAHLAEGKESRRQKAIANQRRATGAIDVSDRCRLISLQWLSRPLVRASA